MSTRLDLRAAWRGMQDQNWPLNHPTSALQILSLSLQMILATTIYQPLVAAWMAVA